MGEEWRRGWHPESIAPKGSDATVLVVGAGPAGLEAARALGQRGYAVTLAEADDELGGRVARESTLPNLHEWAHVRDYRVQQINKMVNVDVYRASKLSASDVISFGATHVVLATGSSWRVDGIGRWHHAAIAELGPVERVYSPDDILGGTAPVGEILIFYDDHYYMGGAIAEQLRKQTHSVTLVTPESLVGAWAQYTSEQHRSQASLMEAGVEIVPSHVLTGYDGSRAKLRCVYTGRTSSRSADSLVLITARMPEDALYHELSARRDALEAGGTVSVT